MGLFNLLKITITLSVILENIYLIGATKSAASVYKPHYGFHYSRGDGHGNVAHRDEYSNPSDGSVKGSYGYLNADGIYRTVNYKADSTGFKANIKTNEPGTANEDPADVHITSLPPPYVKHPVYLHSPKHLPLIRHSYPIPLKAHHPAPLKHSYISTLKSPPPQKYLPLPPPVVTYKGHHPPISPPKAAPLHFPTRYAKSFAPPPKAAPLHFPISYAKSFAPPLQPPFSKFSAPYHPQPKHVVLPHYAQTQFYPLHHLPPPPPPPTYYVPLYYHGNYSPKHYYPHHYHPHIPAPPPKHPPPMPTPLPPMMTPMPPSMAPPLPPMTPPPMAPPLPPMMPPPMAPPLSPMMPPSLPPPPPPPPTMPPPTDFPMEDGPEIEVEDDMREDIPVVDEGNPKNGRNHGRNRVPRFGQRRRNPSRDVRWAPSPSVASAAFVANERFPSELWEML